eukprot:GFKZ01013609.1.p4 GENE.GFKZ01013609.1~~GFKZ01013609.1.p4  ORF type:complete len:100 (+),score=16.83 GFKZ01013609.1:827-1126(+)
MAGLEIGVVAGRKRWPQERACKECGGARAEAWAECVEEGRGGGPEKVEDRIRTLAEKRLNVAQQGQVVVCLSGGGPRGARGLRVELSFGSRCKVRAVSG